jgi:hypothetical protein
MPSSPYIDRPAPSPLYATTGAGGRFQFRAPLSRVGSYQTSDLVATAAGYGVAWLPVDLRDKKDDLTLRLVSDEAPVTGEMVDLQGRPVRDATVRVLHIKATTAEDLHPWLEAVKGKEVRSGRLEAEHFPRQLMSLEVPDLPHEMVTDANGRFRLAGIGRDRLVTVRISGPTIATQDLHILTRPGTPIEVPETTFYPDGRPSSFTTYYGAGLRHVAAPTKPVVGVLRDKDTRRPLAGVTIRSYRLANNPLSSVHIVQTITDARGHYTLTGLPKGKGNKIMVVPADDQPYLVAAADVSDSPGFDPVTLDFELKRGVWIEGRLTDKTTGKPVLGMVHYLARVSNVYVRDYPRYEPIDNRRTWNVRPDGTFRIVGLPGPGLLLVHAGDHYLLALERDDAFGTRDLHTQTIPFRVSTDGANAVAQIDPPKGTDSFHRDVTVDPGETFTGTVLGPNGQALAGVRAYGLAPWSGWKGSPLPTASFTVRAFNRRRPRGVFFVHPEKRLVGALEFVEDKAAPVQVRMRPAAALMGRLVDADGQPRPNVTLNLGFRRGPWELWEGYFPDQITTDRDGRFRIETLLAGPEFFLSDGQGEIYFGGFFGGLRAGATQDLGDVLLKRTNG